MTLRARVALRRAKGQVTLRARYAKGHMTLRARVALRRAKGQVALRVR